MSQNKNFKIKKGEITQLIEPMGGCIATDKITVDGMKVGYMEVCHPINDLDSGWRFRSDTETQEYINDLNNSTVYDVNTIANYDPAIIPYLNLPYGTELERIPGTDKFNIISG